MSLHSALTTSLTITNILPTIWSLNESSNVILLAMARRKVFCSDGSSRFADDEWVLFGNYDFWRSSLKRRLQPKPESAVVWGAQSEMDTPVSCLLHKWAFIHSFIHSSTSSYLELKFNSHWTFFGFECSLNSENTRTERASKMKDCVWWALHLWSKLKRWEGLVDAAY